MEWQEEQARIFTQKRFTKCFDNQSKTPNMTTTNTNLTTGIVPVSLLVAAQLVGTFTAATSPTLAFLVVTTTTVLVLATLLLRGTTTGHTVTTTTHAISSVMLIVAQVFAVATVQTHPTLAFLATTITTTIVLSIATVLRATPATQTATTEETTTEETTTKETTTKETTADKTVTKAA